MLTIISVIPGNRVLLITDLLSETIKSNVRIISAPANSTLENLVPHLKLPENNFSDIDICFIAVGHNDLDTMVGQFMVLYKAMIICLEEPQNWHVHMSFQLYH